MTASPSHPSDQVEAAQVLADELLRDEVLTDIAWRMAFDELSEANKANLRRLFADYMGRRPVASVSPEGMREALEIAASQFRRYEQSHRAKGTSDADNKADTNASMALMCEAALSPPAGEVSDHSPVAQQARIAELERALKAIRDWDSIYDALPGDIVLTITAALAASSTSTDKTGTQP